MSLHTLEATFASMCNLSSFREHNLFSKLEAILSLIKPCDSEEKQGGRERERDAAKIANCCRHIYIVSLLCTLLSGTEVCALFIK